MGDIPGSGSDPILPSPTVITTTSEGKADVAVAEVTGGEEFVRQVK